MLPEEIMIGVFAQEPISAHNLSFAEPLFADGLEHVLGKCRAEVAAWPGSVGEDVFGGKGSPAFLMVYVVFNIIKF